MQKAAGKKCCLQSFAALTCRRREVKGTRDPSRFGWYVVDGIQLDVTDRHTMKRHTPYYLVTIQFMQKVCNKAETNNQTYIRGLNNLKIDTSILGMLCTCLGDDAVESASGTSSPDA